MPALKELTVFIKETRQGHNSHDIKQYLYFIKEVPKVLIMSRRVWNTESIIWHECSKWIELLLLLHQVHTPEVTPVEWNSHINLKELRKAGYVLGKVFFSVNLQLHLEAFKKISGYTFRHFYLNKYVKNRHEGSLSWALMYWQSTVS